MIVIMKAGFLFFASLCLLVQAVPNKVADKTYITRQKNIYELFWHVDQPTVYHPELYQKARTFNLVENLDNYNDKEAVNEFMQLLKHGMLPRGQVFTIMNKEIRHQTVVLFRLLHSAKTFDVFYNTAVWARFNVNEQMFLYALSVAVIHRVDTKLMKLPPLYEVMPHLFFNDDVMQRAYNIAMGDTADMKKTYNNIDYYLLAANYTGWYLTKHNVPEQRLNYLTEDVGLNYFYFLYNHNFPPFMLSNSLSFPQIRGEFYFFLHKQLLNRYYLERLSNDMGEVSYVSLEHPIPTGYYPTMRFRNGLAFPQRETGATVPLHMQKYVQMIHDFHTRISTAIDLGYVVDAYGNHVKLYTKQGLNVLGNIVQGNADSVNVQLYGKLDLLMRKVLGFGYESNVKYQVVPSALQMWSTSLRDPVFFSIYKTIVDYYHKYKENLPKYTAEELNFPGVSIESVSVDKLVTYFDHFESLLNNGVSIQSHAKAKSTMIKARQYRLNHKPFTYHITVNSDKNIKGIVRIFLGPKYDEFGHEVDLVHNYMNFMQMDEFVVNLKSGSNTIERNSHESIFVVPDEVPSDVLYNRLVVSEDGSESFKYSSQPYGFPERLLLPKGKKEGMPYNLLVVVSPFDDLNVVQIDSPVLGRNIYDGRSMGYPLDKPVDSLFLVLSNVQMKEVLVHHREMEELNVAYFFLRQAFPFWLPSKEYDLPDYRGEEYLYSHKLLLNRYYLERLSNDLPYLEEFDWQKPFYPGYYPTMTYSNGLPFPQRPIWSNLPIYKYKYIREIINKESRISAAIDSGYILNNDGKWHNIYSEKGLNILGNIIEGNADSYNTEFYGSIDTLARKILGHNLEAASKYQIVPSALEIFSTSMKDPAFYRIYKRITDYYYSYKMHQKPYNKDEIIYPNLKIESFTVDKLITYFEQFDATINNGLLLEEQRNDDKLFLIKIRQYRLNHKPFNFHITINSDKPMKAVIRIFIGPKYDSHHKLIEIPEDLKYFYEIDNWMLDLNSGLNKITRNSLDCFFTMNDLEPSEIFYEKIETSLNGDKPFTYNERIFGFPGRLLLPRGKKEGMPFQLFLYVSPVSSEYNQYNSRIWGDYKFDKRPFGFPLDKPLYDFNYDESNMLFKDILIYHKDEFDMNITY